MTEPYVEMIIKEFERQNTNICKLQDQVHKLEERMSLLTDKMNHLIQLQDRKV